MRLESRTWFLLSVMFFIGAVYFWLRGNEYETRKKARIVAPLKHPGTNTPAGLNALRSPSFKLLSQIDPHQAAPPVKNPNAAASQVASGSKTPAKGTNPFPLRLTNTTRPLKELSKLDSAILLRNAFIDTAGDRNLAIPTQLKTEADPGSYIVQSKGPIQSHFRERLQDVNASIVAYIPNNAYLVQLSAEGARRLEAAPEIQAVLPYEPYYKLDSKLLHTAVNQETLGDGDWLRVTAFPGQTEAAASAVGALGGQVLDQERMPFGEQLLVKPAADSLSEIAQLSSVQIVELYHPRQLMNDLTRVQMGISPDSLTTSNYLNLSGKNILVNIADSGVDSTQPDLQGRVLGDTPSTLTDFGGHGTHVAGIIAASGISSSKVKSPPDGSPTNANFRGMAPAATLFAVPFRAFPEVERPLNDIYIQETAARTNVAVSKRPTGPMVSNNSWGYTGENEYDSSAARFDAAARDALVDMPGMQPMIFVFAAGNSGDGTDDGQGGQPNSIPSPANAKNVIAVGAMEHLRNITTGAATTNSDGTTSTNALFLGLTDSSDQVASFSSRGNVGIGTEGDSGRFKPDLVAPGTFIVSTRSKDWRLENDVDTNSPQYEILKKVNDPLAPNYRYETGSSQAAPAVSGLLALMQEFFEQRLPAALRRTNSPALMKALVINGARPISSVYDYNVQNSINFQGWGLPNISNSLPALMLSQPEARWPIRIFDQSATNALATGQSRSWSVAVSTNAQQIPMRFTLVWTDPPGNPNAAIKLVNDLDLVVSNTVTGEVFYGNDIRAGSDFTHPTLSDEVPALDNVNNVENVFLPAPGSSNLIVTVVARRVNVTANPEYTQATGKVNDVVQDFALVISTDDPTLASAFTITPITPNPTALPALTLSITNGIPLLSERAGANPPLLNVRDGITNQWNFYVFTNLFITNDISTITNGTNVAFVTFLPPNVGLPRQESADIDLYVSKDPGLLKLDPLVVDAAFKSATRSGTESVVFTNAALGDVFYVGVKSEDQQGGDYGLIALSTDQPFAENKNGTRVLHGLPVPQAIPDGTPDKPGRATIIAIGIDQIIVKRVEVSMTMTHQDFGDLSTTLTHEQTSVVLLNHSLQNVAGTNLVFIYDDQSFGNNTGTRHSDGPGTLNQFGGAQGNGVWMLNVIDSAPSYTGRVENVTIQLDPFVNQDLGGAGKAGISGTVAPNDAACFFVDVPPEATNMLVHLTQLNGPLDVLIEHGAIPTTNSFRTSQIIQAPGGDVTIGANDQPPLEAGRYFICLFNPSTSSTVNFHVSVEFQNGVGLDVQRTLKITNSIPLLDEGIITSTLDLPVDKEVADVQVAVRIDHPRSSDLVLHLISPQGTRILLAENRGGSDSHGYGTGTGTNLTYTIFTENTNLFPNLLPIKFSLPPWTNLNGSTNLPIFTDDFETAQPGPFVTNQTFSNWNVSEGGVIVHTAGDGFGVPAHSGTNYLELNTASGPAAITTSFPTVPAKNYVLSLFFQRNPAAAVGTPQTLEITLGAGTNSPATPILVDVPTFAWQSTNINFTATGNITELTLGASTPQGPLIDTIAVNEAVVATNIYVLPEESLNILRGERAFGDWTLEVWDNRAGPPGTNSGSLIDWQLQVQYGNPADRAILLTNGVPYSGLVLTNQTNFFAIDVCDSANVAFVTLSGPTNSLNLVVDRSGFPTGDENREDFVPILNTFSPLDGPPGIGFATLTLSSDPHYPAPLVPGKRLFLAVYNSDPNLDDTNSLSLMTNNFTIVVSVAPDTCTVGRPIIRLQNDIRYTNLVAPSQSLFDYYVFNVTPTAIEAEFEVRPRNGDVGMVLRHGLPVPDLTNFDYKADQAGITNELIVLTNASQPVPLTPGDWYIGVYNNSTNPVVYDVRASEILDTNFTLIPLTNAIPVDYTIAQGSRLTNFFIFKIFDPHPGVKFELFNLNANADLLIGLNSLPTYTNNFMSNSASPTQPLSIEIRTNNVLTNITGDWLLSVIAKDPTNLSFTVRATLETNAPPAGTNRVFDPDITINGTNICFSWTATVGLQYQLEGKKTIVDPTWTVLLGPFIATNSTINFCTNWPGSPYHFFQVEELGGSTNPPAGGTIVDSTVHLTTNEVCIDWASQIGTNYFVEAKLTLTDETWTNLSGTITATATNTSYCIPRSTPYHFFQVVQEASTAPPPTNGTEVPAELTVSTNGVCLAWASLIGTNYFVEAKQTVTDTTWTNVSGTITATGTNTSYCLPRTTPYHFFQVIQEPAATNQPPPTNGTEVPSDLTVSTNGVCLAWTSLIGTNYFVEAKQTITDTTWTNVSGTITATATNTSYCLPRTTPYRFFQVIQEPAATNQPPSTNGTEVTSELTVSTNGICLEWASQIGTNYFVEAKQGIADTTWTNVSGTITATETNTSYCLPKTTPYHFFQVIQEAAATNQPPSTNAPSVSASLSFGTNGICLSWLSGIGTNYLVDAKRTIVDATWTNLATITATGTNSTYCVPTNSPYHFFEVIVQSSATNSTGGGTNLITFRAPIILTNGGLQLTWDAVIGVNYELQVTTNLLPIIKWLTVTNITASVNPVTVTDPSGVTNGIMRFYRILRP